jgi:O-antigen ligase
LSSHPISADEPGGSRLSARAAWACAALLAALCLQSIYREPVGWLPPLAATALAIAALVRPYDALLLLAGFGPLSVMLFLLIRTGSTGVEFGEALVLAFLAGSAARRAIWPRPLVVSPPLFWSAAVLIALTVAAGVVNAAIIMEESPGTALAELTFIASHYLVKLNTLTSTMLLVEGLLLLLIVADVCARDVAQRDAVLRVMVAGAAAAALLNVVRIVTVAVRHEDSGRALVGLFANTRVNIHFGDLNAAGSYFAMMLLIASSFFARARILTVVETGLIALGLWLSGSRTALAAVFIPGALGGVSALRARWGNRTAYTAAIVLVTVVAAAAWRWYPAGRNATGSEALEFRVVMAKDALRLTAGHPVFGVGPGRFWALSGHLENAHNNFLQIAAELGVPGLVLFVCIIAFAIREAWRRLGPPGPSRGLLAGLAAFLLTCLAGHPLLVAGAAYPFWIALGLAASPASATRRPDRRLSRAAVGVMLVVALTLPFRIAGAGQQANRGQASVGLSKGRRDADGSWYRWAGGRSAFFVESSARAIRIPLRPGPHAPVPMEVRMFVDGREADRILLTSTEEWRTARIVLARRATATYSRIDLEARVPGAAAFLDGPSTDTTGVLKVGRTMVEP